MSLWRVYLRSLRILAAERLLTSLIILAGIGISLVSMLEPILFGRVIDSISQGRSALSTLGLWAGIGLLNIFCSVFVAVMADRLAHRQRLSMMSEIFWRAISLPMIYHTEQGTGRVVRAILSGTDQLFALWLSFLREHFPAILGVIFLVPVALRMDWRLAMVLLALACVYFVANILVLRRARSRQSVVENFHQDVFGRVGDVLGNVTVVQSFTRLSDEAQALQDVMSRLLRAQYPVLNWWALLNVITRVSSTITLVTILAVGSWLVSRGEMTAGEVVTFTGFATLLIGKLDQIAGFFSRAASQAPALGNFFSLFDRQTGTADLPDAKPLLNTSGAVRFEGVTFRYEGMKGGVENVSFSASSGSTTALVGPSGSGKSTTVSLLQRMFDPQSGRILIDDQDIRSYTMASLRQNIATVFQDSGLFNRSIADNIRVGKPSATMAEIEHAAMRAEAHEFIQAKAGGYDFVIGERGSLLSGGERQRIAIARAILKNAPIFIFDEATSALDNEVEKKIQLAISHLRADKTTFIIAHRLSTVVAADHILVFDQGRIVESGKFEELEAAGGRFAQILRAGKLERDKKG
jgi:ATP-binding cassette subfamily B protein